MSRASHFTVEWPTGGLVYNAHNNGCMYSCLMAGIKVKPCPLGRYDLKLVSLTRLLVLRSLFLVLIHHVNVPVCCISPASAHPQHRSQLAGHSQHSHEFLAARLVKHDGRPIRHTLEEKHDFYSFNPN